MSTSKYGQIWKYPLEGYRWIPIPYRGQICHGIASFGAGEPQGVGEVPKAASWVFDPANPPNPTQGANYQFFCTSDSATAGISQNPQLFIINLWQYQGEVPASGTTQEVVLTGFQYVPYSAGTGFTANGGKYDFCEERPGDWRQQGDRSRSRTATGD
jgi:hypothetical protein